MGIIKWFKRILNLPISAKEKAEIEENLQKINYEFKKLNNELKLQREKDARLKREFEIREREAIRLEKYLKEQEELEIRLKQEYTIQREREERLRRERVRKEQENREFQLKNELSETSNSENKKKIWAEMFGNNTKPASTNTVSTTNYKKQQNSSTTDDETTKRKKLELINQFKIESIFHMTHINNLGTLLNHGIMSRNMAINKNFHKNDIADPEVLIHGAEKYVFERVIFDYARFYFNPTNPMLFRRLNLQDKIVIIEIDKNVLIESNVVFSDGNASSKSTKFYSNLNELSKLPWNVIKARYWNDFEDRKRKVCSEALIYPIVPAKFINKIHCQNKETMNKVIKLQPNSSIKIEVSTKYYF